MKSEKARTLKNITEWRVRKEKEKNGEIFPARKHVLKKPYICQEHWHNYWVGSEAKGTRRLERRWIATRLVVGKTGNQTAPCPPEDESGDALKKL